MASLSKHEHAYVLRWSRKIKAATILGGKCRCGEDDIFVLEFHHNSEKTFGLRELRDKKWLHWAEEIKKCTLLCANCHYDHHHQPNRIKDALLKICGERRCCRCPYEGDSLEFHHVGKKRFSLGDVVGCKVHPSFLSVLKELQRCELVCRNCHRREHIAIDKFRKLEVAIRERVSTMKSWMKVDPEKVAALLSTGKTQTEVAAIIGCAKSTVSRYCSRN